MAAILAHAGRGGKATRDIARQGRTEGGGVVQWPLRGLSGGYAAEVGEGVKGVKG